MKVKFVLSLMVAGALSASAQGYQDGVDNFNAGRIDVAKIILNKTINDASTDKAVAYNYLGNINYLEGNIPQAKVDYEKGVQANSENPYNYIGLGKIALMNGNKSEAENLFKQAQGINKKNTAVVAAVARAYYEVDPVVYAKEIDKNITKALKDSKNTESAVFLLQGDMKAKEDPGEAAGLFELAIEADKAKNIVNREAYVKYANTFFKVAPSYAIDKLKELNELEPESALAQRELAEKYYDNEQFGSACQQYEKYMENPNHFQSDEQRYAGLLFSAKRYDESMEIANRVLSKDPNNYFMFRIIMMDKNELKDYPAVEEMGNKLFSHPDVQLIPNDYILYANALSNQGKTAEAVAVYEKAVEVNPNKPELLVDLSDAYGKNGQNEEAVNTMKRYLDGGNGKVNDYVQMARRYDGLARSLEVGSPERIAAAEEGAKYINVAIEKAPNTPIVYAIKSQVLLGGTGNKPNEEIAKTYEKMLELLNADASNREKSKSLYVAADYMLGIYYTDIDKEKAKVYLNDYLTLAPDDERIKTLLNSLDK
ncbi:MAG: tetratricopeptide repeat protein [Bacteroides sp.]|nr:tetratricopeptide repeat protein [Bacteroides sp.]MDE5822949.1 tetratricopeptide repeat protein [Paramuribaculum sp.]